MITVGIRNLRNALSRYLDLVKQGEKVIITDHNRIVAEIVPPQAGQSESEMLQKYLSEQIKSGGVIKASGNFRIEPKDAAVQKDSDLEKIYTETRSERV